MMNAILCGDLPGMGALHANIVVLYLRDLPMDGGADRPLWVMGQLGRGGGLP